MQSVGLRAEEAGRGFCLLGNKRGQLLSLTAANAQNSKMRTVIFAFRTLMIKSLSQRFGLNFENHADF